MEPKYPRTGEPLKRSDEKPAHTGADGRGHLADHTDRLFPFSALVQENADAFAEPFALRRITMRSDIRPDLWLHADQGHITQLLSILLENALKYTNDGGFVTVTLKKEGRGTLLQIADTCDALPDVPTRPSFRSLLPGRCGTHTERRRLRYRSFGRTVDHGGEPRTDHSRI